MVPGEENQLVPKEVRGRRRRLGPRPAAAASSAGRGRGAGCGPSSWAGPAVGEGGGVWCGAAGRESGGVGVVRGGCGEQLGNRAGSRGSGERRPLPLDLWCWTKTERTGRNLVLLCGEKVA